ncbi:MAG: hypothetical protein V2I36_05415, partial [Desulfopila sp.]|nr:hypothetical protein [Desulfopila sp.]
MQGLYSPADIDAVCYPFSWNILGDYQTGFLYSFQEAPPENFRQRYPIKEIVSFDLFPIPPASINTASRHHRMNMGMIFQTSAVGMQHHRHADLRSQMFR